MAEPNGEYALAIEELSKEFGKLRAVDGVTLRVPVGERRAIIGPNGAGKTTLFSLISGELPVTGGQIFLFGHDVTALPPHRRVEFKLGRTYQITNIFQGLSVKENVFLAVQGLSNIKYSLQRSLPRTGPVHDRVTAALESTGLADKANFLAKKLSYGEQRQLELALALATDPRVLLLDEPAAGLSSVERAGIATLIRGLPRTLTIVLIEHDMDLALGLVDRVTCLHFGKLIAEGAPDEIRENAMVQEIYLGVG